MKLIQSEKPNNSAGRKYTPHRTAMPSRMSSTAIAALSTVIASKRL